MARGLESVWLLGVQHEAGRDAMGGSIPLDFTRSAELNPCHFSYIFSKQPINLLYTVVLFDVLIRFRKSIKYEKMEFAKSI